VEAVVGWYMYYRAAKPVRMKDSKLIIVNRLDFIHSVFYLKDLIFNTNIAAAKI
jgi:hypothetical protein